MAKRGREGWVRAGGWLLAALAIAELVSIPLSLAGDVMDRPGVRGGGHGLWAAFVIPAFALSGGLLVHLRPRNPVGWLLLASGLFQVTNLAADAYSTRALTDPDGTLPGGVFFAWVASWTWPPSLLLPTLVLPALYPTGRPPNRYWLWHMRAALLGMALLVLLIATMPGGLGDTVPGTRLPWEAPDWLGYLLGVPAGVLILGAALSVIIGTPLRIVRARGPERQQLLWLLAVVLGMVVALFSFEPMLEVAYGLVPVAVAVGVLRYRLLGIEVVLRRTLLYLPLTLLVALVIGGLTTILARLAPQGPLPLLLSSAVVAVLVIPVAGGLRVLVDRFVRGRPVDSLAVVDRVGSGMEVRHDDPVAAMLEAVASAAGATYAAVDDSEGRRVARVGEPVPVGEVVPLRHGGLALGTVTIGPRDGQTRVADADARLLAALAPQLAVVVRSQMLTLELERERSRVTAATLSERDRLRRDLHDGLGPSLSGIALGLEAAARALDADPSSVAPLLVRTREEADSAVREIRRVLDALRPGALDLNDLSGAVRDTARSLGMGLAGGPVFQLRSDPVADLSPAVEEAAFRIVAECLTNVARHADAGRCEVNLARVNGHLRIAVSDDGRGIESDPGDGHGLESMRRRVADLDGTITVAADHPRGTVVRALLPLGGA